MAGSRVAIVFDDNIEKVIYGTRDITADSPDAITNSGDTLLVMTDMYLLPVLKTGYIIDIVTGAYESSVVPTLYNIDSHIPDTITFTSKLGVRQ